MGQARCTRGIIRSANSRRRASATPRWLPTDAGGGSLSCVRGGVVSGVEVGSTIQAPLDALNKFPS